MMEQEQQDLEVHKKIAQYTALILAGVPLGFFGFLSLLNPQYIGRLILPCPPDQVLCSQPCGWMMLGVILFLVAVSYFGVRGSFILLQKYWWITAIFVFLLFSLPAIFVILLGPAVLIIMETNF